jgi:hypothetical protein
MVAVTHVCCGVHDLTLQSCTGFLCIAVLTTHEVGGKCEAQLGTDLTTRGCIDDDVLAALDTMHMARPGPRG